MRFAGHAASAVALAGALLAAFGGFRYYTSTHWKHVRGADSAACPEAKTLYGDCAACVRAECCVEVHACYSNADCIDLNDCWFKCAEGEGPRVPRAECPAACERRHPASVAAFHAWDDCARSRCETVCPRDPDDEEDEKKK